MANHLHLLQPPPRGKDLPRIIHWIGWYSAMALNRLTGRCGHLWVASYFSTPIDPAVRRRVLATLRYIHANPKAAGVRKGFHDPYSNYGHYELLEGGWAERMASSLPAAGAHAGGMCQTLWALLPPLPASGQAGPQTPMVQSAAAAGWGERRKGFRQKGGDTRPAGAAVAWRRAGSAAAGGMASAGIAIQAGQ